MKEKVSSKKNPNNANPGKEPRTPKHKSKSDAVKPYGR